MTQASRTRLPTHYRGCPQCGLNNAPANNQHCPNCGHDPDQDFSPEKARASIDYALRTAGHDPGRALQALDAVPERHDHMGVPEVRTLVMVLKDPGASTERRKLAEKRIMQIRGDQRVAAKGTPGSTAE